MVQVFASARSNDAVRERLRWFLGEQSRQIARLVDRGRDESGFHVGYSTAAIALLIQAVGVGTHLLLSTGRDDQHLLLSTGRDDQHLPSAQEWELHVESLLRSLTTPPTH